MCFCQSYMNLFDYFVGYSVRYMIFNILIDFRSFNVFSRTDYVYFTRRKTFIISTLPITLFR